TALHHGQLQRYLQLHDIFYPPNSSDESDKSQFNLRVDAESHVIGEYTTVWSIISAGFRGLMGVTGQGDIHAGMQQIQHKKGYTPHPLKQVIYQR
ncbi:hypothetical protein HY214_02945, partial [Candidatus Roizmanbacteria bacterium]|nr:hypothetical protein [Candidatus Roizmanbacteria bacterium]